MPLRDIVIIIFIICSSAASLRRPWIGVLALAILAYLNPHRYAWGYASYMPVYFIVFLTTSIGLVIHSNDRQSFPWTRETFLLFSLLAWYTFTTFSSPDLPQAAQKEFIRVMKLYVGIFPTLFLITTKDKFRWLVIVIALSFGLLGLKGGVFALANGFKWRVQGPHNSFYMDNNDIALALNMTLPLLYCLGNVSGRIKVRLLFYTFFVFSIFSVISSWSRGGIITLGAVLTGIFIVGKRKWILFVFIIIAPFLLMPYLPEGWFERMSTIQTFSEDRSVQGRFYAWRYAIERANRDSFSGGGFGTFQLNQIGDGKYIDAHNAYFEILAEHGYIALGLWLSLLYGTIIALQRIINRAKHLPACNWMTPYARAIQISLAAYAIGAANLGAAYWDYFYHLVSLCVLLKVMQRRSIPETQIN